jgi:replicative DNA helicase
MDGGLGPGELGVVMAPSGIGKSWFLSKIACSALQRGIDVLHYTLELSESYVGQRYTTILTNIGTSEHKDRKEEVIRKIKAVPGRVRIKYYPPQFASSKTLSAHIEKMRQIGFNPQLIIIDYADLMRASERSDSRHEELGTIYVEIRGMSGELGIPVWTASQTQRSSIQDEIIEADKIASSYEKIMNADLVISLSRKLEDKANNTGRAHIMKNRFGPDGITLPVYMNTSLGKIEIFDENSSKGMLLKKQMQAGESLLKKTLAKKFADLHSDILDE